MNDKRITPFYRRVGRRLRMARVMKGMGLQEVADLAGVSLQQIHRDETGEDRITAERLDRISKGLDMPITFFFGSDDNGSPDHMQDALRLAGRIDRLPDSAIRLSIDRLVLAISDAWKRRDTG